LGLPLNLAAFALFSSLVVYFDRTTPKSYKLVSVHRRFHPVIRALYISCVFITVRLLTSRFNKICSIFRIVEFATGLDGPVNMNEKFFYIFEASMMYSSSLQKV
jgi:hypothetical protein